MNVLREGNIVFLQSFASGKNVRCLGPGGAVDGRGKNGRKAQWLVHGPDMNLSIAFQNVQFPNSWLKINLKNGRLCGNGKGRNACMFVVHQKDGNDNFCFQSKKSPNCYMGILPSGDPKLGSETRQGPHGTFKVIPLVTNLF